MTLEPAYDALILHMNYQQTPGCVYTCLCAFASSLYLQYSESNGLSKCCVFRQFLDSPVCSGSVDYVSYVIGNETNTQTACISNDTVGGGLII